MRFRADAPFRDGRAIGGGLSLAADFLFPPACAVCDAPLDAADPWNYGRRSLCTACSARLPWRRTEEMLLPLPSLRYLAFLPARRAHLAERLQALAVFHYETPIPELIRRLKFSDQVSLAPAFAEWIAERVRRVLPSDVYEGALLLPLPLSKSSYRQRAYNQSARIAEALAKRLGLEFRADILYKTRDTPRQSESSALQRFVQSEGAYRATGNVRGRRIILLDDILSSGATLFHAAEALISAGAEAPMAWVLASGRKGEDAGARRLSASSGLRNTEGLSILDEA